MPIQVPKMGVLGDFGVATTHEVSVAGRSCLSNFMSI